METEGSVKQTDSRKTFHCEKCNKSFKQPYLLKRHSVVHTGERKFACSVCNKTFKLQSTLNHHNATHKEEKLFSCSLCRQQFSRASSLRTHMAIHAKTKNFKCNICGRDFVQKGNLTSHMNVHSNTRPYKCNVCGYGFNQGSNLKIHMLKCHSEKTNSDTKKSLNKRTIKHFNCDKYLALEKSSSKIDSQIGGTNPSGEIRQMIAESENDLQDKDQNTTLTDGPSALQTLNNPTLPVLNEDTSQSGSLRLIQSNTTSGLLFLVDDVTGEITLPVIQRGQFLQLMINTGDLDALPDPTNDSTCSSTISNLSLDEIFDPRTIQSGEPSLMFNESLEETLKWYNNICTD
ncbi:uncharacterized protein [Antedon mediterranea]|uniref:uncharacterized protein n=1 Tax=Antedon mediterranea TaxID=105859 RepID=UPI003AF87199